MQEKLWWKAGVGLLGSTLLIHIPFYGASDNTMGILSIIITVIQLLFDWVYFINGKGIKMQF